MQNLPKEQKKMCRQKFKKETKIVQDQVLQYTNTKGKRQLFDFAGAIVVQMLATVADNDPVSNLWIIRKINSN